MILIAETYVSWSTHLETAGEIALNCRDTGESVSFLYIHTHNPDHNPRNLKTLYSRLYLPNERRKIRKFQKILKDYGVNILKQPSINTETKREIKRISKEKFRNIDELKAFVYKDVELGLGVASSLISYTKNSRPDIINYSELISDYVKSALIVFETMLVAVQENNPSEVITFNGRFALSKPIVEAAKYRNIPYKLHERGSSYKHYMLFDSAVHDFKYRRELIKEYWGVSKDDKKQELAKEYYNKRRAGDGIDWYSFVDTQLKGNTLDNKDKIRYTYYSSSDDEIESIGDLIIHPIFKDQRSAIKWLIEYFENSLDAELVIRVHPHLKKKDKEERDWWDNLTGKNVIVITATSDIDTYSLLDTSDVVLTYSSTVGVEATYHGKPSIILGDTMYRNFDCVYEPNDLSDLTKYLNLKKNLKRKNIENCYPFGYYMLTHGIEFRYYQPESLSKGRFMGIQLSDKSLLNRFRSVLKI